MVLLKVQLRAKGLCVPTCFTKKKHCFVSLCRLVAAHHTVMEFAVSAKHLKLLVQPLRVGVGVVAFARTPKSAARWRALARCRDARLSTIARR